MASPQLTTTTTQSVLPLLPTITIPTNNNIGEAPPSPSFDSLDESTETRMLARFPSVGELLWNNPRPYADVKLTFSDDGRLAKECKLPLVLLLHSLVLVQSRFFRAHLASHLNGSNKTIPAELIPLMIQLPVDATLLTFRAFHTTIKLMYTKQFQQELSMDNDTSGIALPLAVLATCRELGYKEGVQECWLWLATWCKSKRDHALWRRLTTQFPKLERRFRHVVPMHDTDLIKILTVPHAIPINKSPSEQHEEMVRKEEAEFGSFPEDVFGNGPAPASPTVNGMSMPLPPPMATLSPDSPTMPFPALPKTSPLMMANVPLSRTLSPQRVMLLQKQRERRNSFSQPLKSPDPLAVEPMDRRKSHSAVASPAAKPQPHVVRSSSPLSFPGVPGKTSLQAPTQPRINRRSSFSPSVGSSPVLTERVRRSSFSPGIYQPPVMTDEELLAPPVAFPEIKQTLSPRPSIVFNKDTEEPKIRERRSSFQPPRPAIEILAKCAEPDVKSQKRKLLVAWLGKFENMALTKEMPKESKPPAVQTEEDFPGVPESATAAVAAEMVDTTVPEPETRGRRDSLSAPRPNVASISPTRHRRQMSRTDIVPPVLPMSATSLTPNVISVLDDIRSSPPLAPRPRRSSAPALHYTATPTGNTLTKGIMAAAVASANLATVGLAKHPSPSRIKDTETAAQPPLPPPRTKRQNSLQDHAPNLIDAICGVVETDEATPAEAFVFLLRVMDAIYVDRVKEAGDERLESITMTDAFDRAVCKLVEKVFTHEEHQRLWLKLNGSAAEGANPIQWHGKRTIDTLQKLL